MLLSCFVKFSRFLQESDGNPLDGLVEGDEANGLVDGDDEDEDADVRRGMGGGVVVVGWLVLHR